MWLNGIDRISQWRTVSNDKLLNHVTQILKYNINHNWAQLFSDNKLLTTLDSFCNVPVGADVSELAMYGPLVRSDGGQRRRRTDDCVVYGAYQPGCVFSQ